MPTTGVVGLNAPLPAWLQRQLLSLLPQKGHALLLAGPPGLGQYDLALALASAWLCETPSPDGACGKCGSCHAIAVRTHPDLLVLMPETLALETGWPLDEKTQDKIDKKEVKASKWIRVEATRDAVAFAQMTRSRGNTKVVLIYPADRLNHEAANTLLKTLEEPPGALRFVLATDAAHALLPTLRSRCQTHALNWPHQDEVLPWLEGQFPQSLAIDLKASLTAGGGRPAEAAQLLGMGLTQHNWGQLPRSIAQGDLSPIAGWTPPQQLEVLQKLCHDLMCLQAQAAPRFFAAEDLPPPPPWQALLQWCKQLQQAARTAEHPFNAGLLTEAWGLAAQDALRLHSQT
jgi:DNA polymerase III subunit delta'